MRRSGVLLLLSALTTLFVNCAKSDNAGYGSPIAMANSDSDAIQIESPPDHQKVSVEIVVSNPKILSTKFNSGESLWLSSNTGSLIRNGNISEAVQISIFGEMNEIQFSRTPTNTLNDNNGHLIPVFQFINPTTQYEEVHGHPDPKAPPPTQSNAAIIIDLVNGTLWFKALGGTMPVHTAPPKECASVLLGPWSCFAETFSTLFQPIGSIHLPD